MELVYIDTSAFVKNFSREKGSERLEQVFNLSSLGKVNLFTSRWTVNESVAALDKKFGKDEISLEERDKSIATLIAITHELSVNGLLTLVPVRQEDVGASLRQVMERHLSAEDALQLYSALLSDGTIFIAADEFLLSVAKKEGLESYNVEVGRDTKELLRKMR